MSKYVPTALRWLVAFGKVLSILAGLSAYQGMIPPKYMWAAVLGFGCISALKEIVMIFGDLLDDGQRNNSFKLPLLAALAALPILSLVACSAVPNLPAPMGATVEAQAAAITKAAVLAHPELAPWGDGLAKAARSVSGDKLPTPETLQLAFNVFSMAAPASISTPAGKLLDLYRDDYAAAVAIHGTAAPWLERLAIGIQTGERQAGLGEAP